MPREHGAWAILAVPYLAGASLGMLARGEAHSTPGSALPDTWASDSAGALAAVVSGMIALLLIFLSRPNLSLLLKRKIAEGSFGKGASALLAGSAVLALPGLAILAILVLAGGYHELLWIALAGGALFGMHSWFSYRRQERAATAELIGILMLSLGAPAGSYLAQGSTSERDLWLWVYCCLYFGVSVWFVKTKLRSSALARKKSRNSKAAGRLTLSQKLSLARPVLLYIGLMAAALTALVLKEKAPAGVILAYLPATLWIFTQVAMLPGRLKIKTEGVVQTVLAGWFLAALVWSQ